MNGVNESIAARALACDSLASSFATLGLASIQSVLRPAGTSVPTSAECLPLSGLLSIAVPVDVCQVVFDIATSTTSRTHFEAWLPAVGWNGRLLATGTIALSGCVDFAGLSYGASMGFATIGTDAGHAGPSAVGLLNAPEVQRDFFGRAVHTEAVVGKQLVSAYYGSQAAHSYFMGCSQGGRQGFQAAGEFPYDFDGVLAGDPVFDIAHLSTWLGLTSSLFLPGKPGAMSPAEWARVHDEAFRQCDALDGKVDRTIAYPDRCKFDVRTLAQQGFNEAQVGGLQKLYSDLRAPDGILVFPRFDPGAENTGPSFNLSFGSTFPTLALEYFRYVVFSDPTWDPGMLSLLDGEIADKMQLPGTHFFNDLRKFKERGGKIITYHGTQDTLVNSGVSELQYARAAKTTGGLDKFYALYLVPGMDHCFNFGGTATGPWRFGQMGAVPPPRSADNTSTTNALLALVDWVETGHAPERLVGLTDAGERRDICRYPVQGRWRGGVWSCQA